MKLSRLISLVGGTATAAFLGLSSVACGGGGGDDPGTTSDGSVTTDGSAVTGTETKFVISAVNVPNMASEQDSLGFNLDGRPGVDNKLSSIMQTIETASAGTNLQMTVDTQIAEGDLLLLLSYFGQGFGNQSGAATQIFFGTDADQVLNNNFTGSGVFVKDTATASSQITGRVSSGKFTSEGTTATTNIKLAFVEGSPTTIPIISARMEANVSATGVMNGKIGGGITKRVLEMDVLPVVYTSISNAIMMDPNSSGSMTLKTLFDGQPTTASTGCPVGVRDGTVTMTEFLCSNTIKTILSPDLDLLVGDGSGGLVYGTDGTKESVSLGIGFTAVPASY